MKKLKKWAVTALTVVAFVSCENDDKITTKDLADTHVSAVIKFDHSLAIGDNITIKNNADGTDQTLILKKFKYLISDVKITKIDNTVIEVPNNIGGHLIDLAKADDKEVKVYLSGIPAGTYKAIDFAIGVSQETANGSAAAQSKLFDLAAADMNWSWNPNSYIFSKIEATNQKNTAHHLRLSQVVPTTTTADTYKDLSIHIGKKGDFDGYRTVTLNLTQNITVKSTVSPSIHVPVSIEKLFKPDTGHQVYLDAPDKADFSDNYKGIFKIHHVHPSDAAISTDDIKTETHHDEETSGQHTH